MSLGRGCGAREAAIACVALGWTIALLAVLVSTVATGNFLFEYAPTPGGEEIVSPYFKVAAAAAILPLGVAGLILAGSLLRGRRR